MRQKEFAMEDNHAIGCNWRDICRKKTVAAQIAEATLQTASQDLDRYLTVQVASFGIWDEHKTGTSLNVAAISAVSASKKKFCIPGYSASALPTNISTQLCELHPA